MILHRGAGEVGRYVLRFTNLMRTVLAFRTISVDTLLFPAGTVLSEGDKFRAYNPSHPQEEELITEKKKREEDVIKWLMNSPAKNLLLDELSVDEDSFIAWSVTRPIIENTQEKPGDIDILICEAQSPEHAIAFQCKPVSVVAFDQDEDDVNKIPDIKEAVLQANKQRDKLGFYKNYLVIIIKAYGRKRTGSNVLFRGPTPETLKRIYEFPQRESLHDDVGIVFIEIVQPTGKSFNKMVQVGVCLDKEAAVLNQTANLTNRVREYMRSKGVI